MCIKSSHVLLNLHNVICQFYLNKGLNKDILFSWVPEAL